MFYTLFSQLSYQFPKLSEGGAQEFHWGGGHAERLGALLLWFEDNTIFPGQPLGVKMFSPWGRTGP